MFGDDDEERYNDVDLGDGVMRQGNARDWATGVRKQATSNLRRGMCSGLVMLFVFGLAIHIAADFYDEYDSDQNREKTERAQLWVQGICQQGVVLPPDAVAMCGDYRDWASRSLSMNALRLSLHNHVNHVHAVGSLLTGGWLPGDSFLGFQTKQVINAVCTSLATAIPILVLLGVVYVALLLRGPVMDLRAWLGLNRQQVEPPRARYVRLGRDTFVRGRARDRGFVDAQAPASVGRGWMGLSDTERSLLARSVMRHLRAGHKNHDLGHGMPFAEHAYVPYEPPPTRNTNLFDAGQQFAHAHRQQQQR